MPTHQDETLPQRYAREHQDYLKLCGSMTAEQVADIQLQLHNSLAREQALQQRLTAADERVDALEGLLREVQVLITAEPFGVLSGMSDQSKRMDWYDKPSPVRDRIDAALKPADASDEHVCNGCGAKGWAANCKECVPY